MAQPSREVYWSAIQSFGEVLLRVDGADGGQDDESGGDSCILYREGDRYGILVIG
jgi:hypothetical protein